MQIQHIYIYSICHDFYLLLRVVTRTHIILADLTDEVLSFVHGSWRRSEHRESLLIHLVYRHALKRQRNHQFQHSVTQSVMNNRKNRKCH